MKAESFTEFKTGRPVPITNEQGKLEYAFVPDDLPPQSCDVPESLWPLVVQANAEVSRLDGIGQTLPHPRLLLRPLQRREALKSCSIEGTIISPKDLLLFEALEGFDKEAKDSQESNWREVYNYYETLRIGNNRVVKGEPIDRELMKRLHRILLTGVRGESKNPGEFREEQNHIGATHRFSPPPPNELAECLTSLEQFLLSEDDFDPLIKAYIAHYQFEAIHPFKDGNGRIGRVLLSLTISHWLNLARPWLYMSEFFDENRSEYLDKLFRVSTHGEWAEWLEFCLNGTVRQAVSAVNRCKAIRSLQDKYSQKAGRLGGKTHLIINMLFDNPVIAIADVQRKCNVHYTTAKNAVSKLEEAGILVQLHGVYPKTFIASELINVAYV